MTDGTWRVGHRGRDQMYYEELVAGHWERIEVQGEMLMGRAHHAIYFASPSAWNNYPSWAHGRRDEIIARIKGEFREPDYEYHGDDQPSTPSGDAPHATGDARPATDRGLPRRPAQPEPRIGGLPRPPAKPERRGMRALLLAILIFLAIGGATGWMTVRGLGTGVTTLPLKRASFRRPVARTQEPATYWLSITVYAGISIGAIGASAWLLRERRRLLREGA
jgi:hypothetical protein